MSSTSSLRFVGVGSSLAIAFALLHGCTVVTADGVADGGADAATTDSATTSDSSTTSDSGKDGSTSDSAAGDSASDAKADASGDGAANACSPQPVTTVPAYVAAPHYKGVCSPQQLVDFRLNCYSDDPNADCQAWASNPANTGCYDCEGDMSTKTEYGLLTGFQVGLDSTFELNLGGWMQALDPSKTACATKLQAVLTCKIKSCSTACPLAAPNAPDAVYDAAAEALDKCLSDSTMSACKTYLDDTTCLSAETANPLLAPLFNYLNAANEAESYDAYFQTLAVMCGANPGDAGTTDSSTGDASDAAAD